LTCHRDLWLTGNQEKHIRTAHVMAESG